jgi:DNA-directed RNA polymerase subunit RPC12/RpoP
MVSYMGLIDILRKPLFAKIVLIFWILSSVFLVFLLRMIDSIVNVTLYQYGLQPSMDWLSPYWFALRLIYVLLAVPAALSVTVLIAGFGKTGDNDRIVRRVSNKVSTAQPQTAKEHSVLIRCIHCGKVFSKPETMLDFSNGKPQLANVCPYCEHVLGKPEEKRTNESVEAEFGEEVQTE